MPYASSEHSFRSLLLADPLFQTSCVGVAVSLTACIGSLYLWWRDRRDRYLWMWAAAWGLVTLRWLLHFPAATHPAARLAEMLLITAALSMFVLGAYQLLPQRRWPVARVGAGLVLAHAAVLLAALAYGQLQPLLFPFGLGLAIATVWLIWANYRATRIRGFLVLALMTALWMGLSLGFAVWLGVAVGAFVLLPLLNLPLMIGFLMVSFERSRHRVVDAESKLNRIFDTAPVPLIVARYPRGEAEQFNQATLDLTGLSASELRGRTGAEAGLVTDEAALRTLFGDLRDGGSVSGRELVYHVRGGAARTIVVNAATVNLEDGKRFIFALHDLTQLRAAQEQARQALEKFTALFETNPVGIAVTRPDEDRIYEINDAALQIAGLTREQALGRPASTLIRWHDRAEQQAGEALLGRGGRLTDMPGRFTRIDGSSVDVLLSGLAVTLNGRPHLITTYRDVTQQRRQLRALADSEERFSKAFEFSQEAVLVMRLDDASVVAVNPCFEAMYGAPEAEVLGKTPLELDLWTGGELAYRVLLARLEGEGALRDIESVVRTRGGEERTCSVSVARFEVSREAHAIVFMRDITEQRRAEVAVRELNASLERRVAARTAELEQANKDLEGFSYSVAHDLRGPLRAIAGFSALARTDYAELLPEDGRKHLKRIEEAAMRMSGLLDGLLEFARTGRAQLESADVDMQALVAEVIRDSPDCNSGRIHVSVGALPPARGDALLLRQVWRNLIDNACKFSARNPAPNVEIGAISGGAAAVAAATLAATAGSIPTGSVQYYVRDNGVGFDMEHAEKLFGVFQRLHPADGFEGTGVGLAIVARIVTRHGGHIWAEGTPGQGATFRFCLGA
jgi:PAS domain S-box-containing protein